MQGLHAKICYADIAMQYMQWQQDRRFFVLGQENLEFPRRVDVLQSRGGGLELERAVTLNTLAPLIHPADRFIEFSYRQLLITGNSKLPV